MTKPVKHPTLWFIAAFKCLKGLALLLLAVGALRLLHRDLADDVLAWINVFRVAPAHRYVQMLLDKLAMVNDRRIEEFSAGTFLFSILYLTEGVGLALNKKWAKYLTVVSTAALIPIEIYEIFEHASVGKFVLFLVNVGVVFYLIHDVRRHEPG